MTIEEMNLLWLIGYIMLASIITAVFSVVYEGKDTDIYPPAVFIGAFWLPIGVGALGFLLLVGIPYKLTRLVLDKLKKVC